MNVRQTLEEIQPDCRTVCLSGHEPVLYQRRAELRKYHMVSLTQELYKLEADCCRASAGSLSSQPCPQSAASSLRLLC
jgi:hypothetical protein